MKEYNPTTGWFGKKSVHTVRVTLMQEDYIGHVAYEVYGNCTGADVLVVGTKGEEFCDVPPIDGFVEVLRHG